MCVENIQRTIFALCISFVKETSDYKICTFFSQENAVKYWSPYYNITFSCWNNQKPIYMVLFLKNAILHLCFEFVGRDHFDIKYTKEDKENLHNVLLYGALKKEYDKLMILCFQIQKINDDTTLYFLCCSLFTSGKDKDRSP